MKDTRKRYILPVVIGAVIVVFVAIGLLRKHDIEGDSSLVENFKKPGGDTLAVGIEMSPLTYILENDTAEGFDYLMLRDMARQHGVPVKFHPFTQLDRAFTDLKDKKYDLLVAAMPSTAALKEYFPLTDAVYIDRQVLVQLADSAGGKGAVGSQEQLMGDTLWIAKGKPFKTRLQNMAKELGDTITVLTDPEQSSEHLAIMTALGQIKHAVVGEAVARRVARQYPQLDISTPISLSQFQVWAVAPGDSALLDTLNRWIDEFKATAEYRRLAEHYLSNN